MFKIENDLMNIFSAPSARVEKTRKQREHAHGTPRDLPRNTPAQKLRITSPLLPEGKKGLTRDTRNELTGTRQTDAKQRLRDKQK